MVDSRTGDGDPDAALERPPPLAVLAPPMRWIGTACFVLAGIVFIAVAGLVAAGELAPEPGLAIGPALFLGLGFLLRAAARHFRDGTLDLPRLAGLLFPAVGAAMALGGALMVYDDPAGFALLAFGLVFIGIGFLARRLFAPPPGKKAVVVSGFEAVTRRLDGRRGIVRQSTVIHVDESASAAQVDAAKEAWLRERWSERPDWVEGRILAEEARGGSMLYLAVGLWVLFALAGLAAALHWDDWLAWLVAAGGGIIAAGLVVLAVLRALRRRKFAESRLALRESPAVLGGRLLGEVETGVRQSMVLRDGFRVVLRCVRRWEETRRTGTGAGSGPTRTVHRHEVLWEEEQRGAGHAPSASLHLAMPISFRLPDDRPASTLDGSSEGISWELAITAAMPGVDYVATFQVPVLAPGAARLLRSAAAALAR